MDHTESCSTVIFIPVLKFMLMFSCIIFFPAPLTLDRVARNLKSIPEDSEHN